MPHPLLVAAFLRTPAQAQTSLQVPLPASNQSGDDTFIGTIGDTVDKSKSLDRPSQSTKPGRPNVIFIVLDDVGFSDLGCYGSEIDTHNIDRLAAEGVRFNNFHTRAICSPTRASLLTGRNSHTVGVNTVADLTNGFPNGRGRISPHAATIAQILQDSGYATFAVGKWHLVPGPEQTPAGPYDNWPLQKGFDHFYGYLGGLTDQFHPDLYQDNTPIEAPIHPAYHLSEDLVDRSITYIQSEQTAAPKKPFFLYLALGAAHAPHQAPPDYIRKYLPVFSKGWDVARQQRFAREKALGVIPSDTRLAPANPDVKAWGSLSPDEQRLFTKYQAAYAGYLEHADAQIGRLLDYLEKTKKLQNSLIVLISDNGATSEGGQEGFTNMAKGYLSHFMKSTPKNGVNDGLERIEDIGTERAGANYPMGWAQLGNTPFKLYKEFVFGGGVNDPLIVRWPEGIRARGAIRNQFVDVIDITPTVLEATGTQAPAVYRGLAQMPIDGKSILQVIDDPTAPAPRNTQYFELNGHRAIWHDGWKAVTFHKPRTDFNKEPWELYDVAHDYAETQNLATQEPARLQAMKDLWWHEARTRGVLPMSDDPITHLIQSIMFRKPSTDVPPLKLYPGQFRVPGDTLADFASQPIKINARLNRANDKYDGVLVSVGDSDSGWIFYIKNDRLILDVNSFGSHTIARSTIQVPIGHTTVRADIGRNSFAIFIDGVEVGSGKGAGVQAALYGMLQVGKTVLSPVTWDVSGLDGFAFPKDGIEEIVLSRG